MPTNTAQMDRPITLMTARQMDESDPLKHKRSEFYLPEDSIYLDGNSLGPLPVKARERVQQVVVEQWGEDLIKSWNTHSWIDLPVTVGEKIAPLIGAAPGQTICCDSISVNLFKLLGAALKMRPGRHQIVSQSDNFPTDLYMVEGLQELLGKDAVELVMVDENDIFDGLNEDVAVLLLTQVNFRSGRIHNMAAITEAAHAHGILVIWDLAHSAGAIPVELDLCKVDFAVGCGYKYLNGGPGAPAFIYVAERHLSEFAQPLSGWMGHSEPFAFKPHYHKHSAIEQCLAGTPPIISMSMLDAALEVFSDVTMQQLRQKSVQLSEFFLALIDQIEVLQAFSLASPIEPELRGSQIALTHPQAFSICQALISKKVIADFRAPNILRIGFCPLYLSFTDVYHAVTLLSEIIDNQMYKQQRFQTATKVT